MPRSRTPCPNRRLNRDRAPILSSNSCLGPSEPLDDGPNVCHPSDSHGSFISPAAECSAMTRDRSDTEEVLIEVALPEELLEEVDRYAHGHGTTRSAVVAAALSE